MRIQIGEVLKDIRKQKGISQQQLVDMLAERGIEVIEGMTLKVLGKVVG